LKFFGDESEGPSTSLWNFNTLDNKDTKKIRTTTMKTKKNQTMLPLSDNPDFSAGKEAEWTASMLYPGFVGSVCIHVQLHMNRLS
jgi:hypothetical protein